MPKSDPVRERYYNSVESAEQWTYYLFYIGAALSIVSLLVDQKDWPKLYVAISVLFPLVVVALFVIGLVTRLYFTPRAEQKRREDFLTQVFGVSLTHENTEGYYNNEFSDPAKRLAAQVLENSLFTMRLTLRVARRERAKLAIYFMVYLVCVFIRNTNYGIILAATQAVFSEQMISKAVRVEWLRTKCEVVHKDVYRLFQTNPAKAAFLPMAIDSVLLYETAKANAAVVIPSELFDRLNPELSTEWNEIKAKLKIG
jgi:hypothetical protein